MLVLVDENMPVRPNLDDRQRTQNTATKQRRREAQLHRFEPTTAPQQNHVGYA